MRRIRLCGELEIKGVLCRKYKLSNRKEFGHWEIDLVVGRQGSKPVILTLVERQTRKSIYSAREKQNTKGSVAGSSARPSLREGGFHASI